MLGKEFEFGLWEVSRAPGLPLSWMEVLAFHSARLRFCARSLVQLASCHHPTYLRVQYRRTIATQWIPCILLSAFVLCMELSVCCVVFSHFFRKRHHIKTASREIWMQQELASAFDSLIMKTKYPQRFVLLLKMRACNQCWISQKNIY